MKSRKIALLCILAGALLASPVSMTGCMTAPQDPYGIVDPFEADPTDAASNNNTFDRATAVALTGDTATIDSVLSTYDVDVYNLGPVAAGDRLIVDVDIPDRILLNAAVGVFDQVGRVFYLNEEPTQLATVPLTDAQFPAFAPHFEYVVRQATSPLYLAIASLPELVTPADPTGFKGYTAGPYTINVSFQRGGLVPLPVKQVVALQFDDSVVDYPPMEDFGSWSDMPPMSLVGLNGQVLDPAWWRPFIIMAIELQLHQNPNDPFWVNFQTFVTSAALPVPNPNAAPAQLYGILVNEWWAAVFTATANPPTFTPSDPSSNPGSAWQWFPNNGFLWLNAFGLYLGPGYTAPAGGGGVGQTTAGLGIWNSVLAAGYPTAQDSRFGDSNWVAETVRAKLQDMYAGLNVEFLIVGQDEIPTDVPVQHLYLVSDVTGVGILGLASSIDIGNVNQSDFATIFGGELGYSNSFALGIGVPGSFVSPQLLTDDLGFICGHELGHTLGLVHTNSMTDVMKRYGGGVQDLTAAFSTAPLDSSMFPIGYQDSGLLLLQALGMGTQP
jgi:hypothetical protein